MVRKPWILVTRMIYLKKLCDNFLPHIDRNKDTLACFNENCPGIQSSLDCVRTKTLESWLRSTSEKPDRVLAPTLSVTAFNRELGSSLIRVLGIQMQPQNQVPSRPCFEIRSAAQWNALPFVSVTVLASALRTVLSKCGKTAVIESSDTTKVYG